MKNKMKILAALLLSAASLSAMNITVQNNTSQALTVRQAHYLYGNISPGKSKTFTARYDEAFSFSLPKNKYHWTPTARAYMPPGKDHTATVTPMGLTIWVTITP